MLRSGRLRPSSRSPADVPAVVDRLVRCGSWEFGSPWTTSAPGTPRTRGCNGCTVIQGFLFGRPAADVPALLAR
jgi:hypothetical protein